MRPKRAKDFLPVVPAQKPEVHRVRPDPVIEAALY